MGRHGPESMAALKKSDDAVRIGFALRRLSEDQAEFSQATFGSDDVVGPIGPLKHLSREAIEAAEAPNNLTEYADCLLLLLDASRRAGFSVLQLVTAAGNKLLTNKKRKWKKPQAADEPIEHVRG